VKATNFKFTPAYTIAVGILLTVLIVHVQSSAQSHTAHYIRFTRGATSKTVKVILAESQDRPIYLVKKRIGQKMALQ